MFFDKLMSTVDERFAVIDGTNIHAHREAKKELVHGI